MKKTATILLALLLCVMASCALAYDKTVLKCHELKWPYCNGILKRWHEAGLHTAEAVKNGDRKPGQPQKNGQRQLDADERAAIERMLSEV